MIAHIALVSQPPSGEAYAAAQDMTVHDLSDAVKHIPPLAPDDSAARAIRIMQTKSVPAVLVAEDSRLVGMVSEADVVALAGSASEVREVLRRTHVSEIMQPIPVIALEQQELSTVAEEVRLHPVPAIPVAMSDGRYVGLLLPRDLLAAMAGEPVVPPIAGLATPLGVYLTTGALRAGATDFGLVVTGAALMVLNLCAVAVISGMGGLADRLLDDRAALLDGGAAGIAIAVVLYGLEVGIFLLLLRLSPLAGIHAAEHMVVRAVEEGADLTLQKVRQMPRVHPRCGTNLMALVVLLLAAYQLVSSIQADSEFGALALVVLVVLVAFTWRRLGAGLQRWITTKRPSDRQLAAAIRVGESLLGQVQARPSARVSMPKRIWHTGFIQVLVGFFVVALLAQYGPRLAVQAWHFVTG